MGEERAGRRARYLLCEVLSIEWGSLSDLNLFSYLTLAGAAMGEGGGRPTERERLCLDRAELKRACLERVCRTRVDNLDRVRAHLDEVKSALLANGYSVKRCKVVTEGRGLVGTGEAFGRVLFEVGLSFDQLLNVPVIPGRSLKGAFRHALAARRGEQEAERVFGRAGEVGLVGVTDAYPVEVGERLFEPDILTPHYPETGRVETELDVEPNPVPFLTVAPGVRFEFYVYYDKKLPAALGRRTLRASEGLDGNADILAGDLAEAVRGAGERAADALPLVDYAVVYALTRGVGAKTSLGYTRFRLLEYGVVDR